MDLEERMSYAGLKTMQLNDQKAGMEGLNKETINKIIYEASKDTPYFTFQEKRQHSIDSKVKELQLEMQKITKTQRKESLTKMDDMCKHLEQVRDLSHSIVHIDMDAFYAAVETHDNPSLNGKPMAVGSMSMLSTSNYLARKYGVRAAMPGFIAKKLCPDLVIVPTHFDRYRAISNIIRNIVEQYDPHYSAASLDEVYLDLTEYIKNKHKKEIHEKNCLKNGCDLFMDNNSTDEDMNSDYTNCMNCAGTISNEERDKMAFAVVQEIRDRIFEETKLTASAGIAPNTMLAKVCSDQNKPNGQYQIISSAHAVKNFISTLPVKKVSGIGPVQGQILNAIGINTCEDMWNQRHLVANLFTPNSVDFYMRVALGIGSTTVRSDYDRKSIGNERTFREISKPEELHKKCEELSWNLIEDLKSHKLLGKLVVLKIKTTSFKTYTRNHSLSFFTDDPEVIFKAAKKLLEAEITAAAPQPLKLRLMGVRMCNLVPSDSVSSTRKLQITLKSFLKPKHCSASTSTEGSSSSKEKFSCPVCSDTLEIGSENFDKHVNNCMNNQNFTEELGRKQGLDSNELVATKNECNNYQSSSCSTSSAENIEYFCPVCEQKQNISNLIQLNQHIDDCLNKMEIRKILASDYQITEKRKSSELQNGCDNKCKIAKKGKKIDEYFK